ncbi:MAG: porphobilinogen synthase [Chlamydiales bacterium]|nr:porphobilinogen synthase [Chlamydiales bacterium]
MRHAFPLIRKRRLRQNSILRDLVQESDVDLSCFILPLFIKGEQGEKKEISSMQGHFQIPLNLLASEVQEVVRLGIKAVILFGVPPRKDLVGSDSFSDDGIIQKAVKIIKNTTKELLIISDVCFCEYTDHGHCGFLSECSGKVDIDNDKTVELLVQQAVSHARAGVDVVAPSGMIDGMVLGIRKGLDNAGFSHIPILSYSVKYNSAFYGPFRSAAEGAPTFGDRGSHMMDVPNGREAVHEAGLDIDEGADMLMIKPAHTYLDIIFRVKQKYPYMPLGAYHTSGEFCMIKAAAEKGYVDEKKAVMEVMRSIHRAGADFIITYFAKEIANWIKKE